VEAEEAHRALGDAEDRFDGLLAPGVEGLLRRGGGAPGRRGGGAAGRPGGGAAGLIRAKAPALQVVRGLAMVVSALSFIAALRALPLAEATATNFASLTCPLSPHFSPVVGLTAWSGGEARRLRCGGRDGTLPDAGSALFGTHGAVATC
jgi:hypothetical protein